MNGILTTNSEVNRTTQKNNSQDVETTGSLAMLNSTPLFNIPFANYDMFIPTNPFSLNIDFGSYAEQENNTLASNSTFMQGFANALGMLYENSSFGGYSGAGCASVSSGGCAGGSCSVGGGFTSVG